MGLEVRTTAYKTSGIVLNSYDLNKQLPELKKDNPWLYDINAQSLQDVLKNLDSAFTNFFNNDAKYPIFKSKRKSGSSAKFLQKNKIIDNRLKLMKFPEGIKIVLDKRIPKGIIKNVVVSKSATNKYFASITYETGTDLPEKKPIRKETAVGIDMGIKDFSVLSDGRKFSNPKFLKQSQAKLKVLQRRLSRKKKGSNRYKLQKYKIAKQYEKIANQRKDFQHKLSNQITNEFDTLCFETLRIGNMMKNHSLAGAIGDAAWCQFFKFCSYKTDWKGGNILQIGTFEPSSKLCTCGAINNDLKLSDREWDCLSCGAHHDRDTLAANNIVDFAIKNYIKHSGQGMAGEGVELLTLVGAKKRQLNKYLENESADR